MRAKDAGWGVGGLFVLALVAAPQDQKPDLFQKHIRPVLSGTCMKCHGGEKVESGLNLSTREGLLGGGPSGPAVVPGDAQASRLIKLISHQQEPHMPKNGPKLSDELIAHFSEWINAGAPYDGPLDQDDEFFETKIRPVLVDRCYGCHSAEAPKLKGDLRLDTVEALMKEIVPGDPDKSVLIQAVRYTEPDLKMPPKKPLTPAQVADLEAWVKMGAPTARKKSSMDPKRFWSFQPPKDSPGSIDDRIRAKLREKGLDLNPPADRRTLLRRVTYDLIGLPPAAKEVEAFESDPSPDAFARVVDRLLASPRYGERWGRYWLDVARYADTSGDVSDTGEQRLPFSYVYRDWVIRAFNEDLPYDQFILQQLAADRLNLEDKRALAAMGFVTLGRRFFGNIHDVIDDRIDVVTRGFLGLSVACARCHDHKYDPIPTQDYYSLYGVFASSEIPKELPLLGRPEDTYRYDEFLAAVRMREEKFDKFCRDRFDAISKSLRTPEVMAQYLAAAQESKDVPEEKLLLLARDRKLSDFVLKRWVDYIKKNPKPDVQALASDPSSPAAVTFQDLDKILPLEDTIKKRQMQRDNDQVKATHPGAPPRAPCMHDLATPVEPVVFKRGNAGNPGEKVPRRFLAVLSGPERKPFTDGSGRLELARAIASKDNPLTARVMVNRIWAHHFGAGLVRTPSDFGVRGEPPTHPELLDYLACRFVEDGWSMKKMHRRILLSAVYQQSSADQPRARRLDPENTLLRRMNRRRLDAEALRDSLLAVSGTLELDMGGPPVDLSRRNCRRRTVYGLVERARLASYLRTFDFPDPNAHASNRFMTILPQQALFFMNSPFVISRVREIVDEMDSFTDPADRVRALYRTLYARAPTSKELDLALRFIQSGSSWLSLVQVLVEANEFSFVD